MTHYDILQISREADGAQIRTAYRRLVKIYHPDHSDSPDAHQVFIRIVEAYEVLTDTDRRRNYDRMLDLEENARKAPESAAKPKPPQVSRPTVRDKRRISIHTPIEKPVAELKNLESFMRLGRFAEAEKLARKIKQMEPRIAKPYAVLGDLARMRGELERAAEFYAYAMQLDPRTGEYEREHTRVLVALSRRRGNPDSASAPSIVPIYVAAVVILASISYTAIARESALFPGFSPISTWSIGLVVLLFVSGAAVASCFSLSGYLDAFGSSNSAAVMRIPPPVALGLLSIVSFWASAALYVLIGMTQSAFNASLSRIVSAVALVTLLMTVAAGISPTLSSLQVLLWGGNVVYLGAACGWLVTDALRS